MYTQAGGYITEKTSTYDFIIRICGSEFQWNNADRKQAENRLYRSQSQFATFLSHTIRDKVNIKPDSSGLNLSSCRN